MIEALESRCLLSATVEVTAKGAAAYEGGPSRFFYIRRSGDTSQPQSVFYIVGGKAKQTLDYHPIGTGITIQPGRWLRRIEKTCEYAIRGMEDMAPHGSFLHPRNVPLYFDDFYYAYRRAMEGPVPVRRSLP